MFGSKGGLKIHFSFMWLLENDINLRFSVIQFLVVMSKDERATDISNSGIKTALSYTDGAPKSHNGRSLIVDSTAEEPVAIKGESEPVEEPIATQQIRAAKIHDFCLGIPFGKFLFMVKCLILISVYKN